MIAELFLVCAMAVPPTQFPHDPMTVADLKVFYMLGRYGDDPVNYAPETKKIYLIQSPGHWLFSMRERGMRAFRLTHMPLTSGDIIGLTLQQPMKRNSVHIVIFGGISGHSAWGSMRILSESVFPLLPYGYFVFQEYWNPMFSRYLLSRGYFKLPFKWREFSIYQKRNGYHGELKDIREGA